MRFRDIRDAAGEHGCKQHTRHESVLRQSRDEVDEQQTQRWTADTRRSVLHQQTRGRHQVH